MARAGLTPKDIEYKKVVSSRLKSLLSRKGVRKIEVSKATGIPASTLTGYFKGTTLPSPQSVRKLAKYFDVLDFEIDPRFDTDKEKVELDSVILTYKGKIISSKDVGIFKQLLEWKESK